MWISCGRCGHGGHQKCMRMYYCGCFSLRAARLPDSEPDSTHPRADWRPVSTPLHTLPSTLPTSTQAEGSGVSLNLHRTNSGAAPPTAVAGTGTGTSHDSSGFIVGAAIAQAQARSSHETLRDQLDAAVAGESEGEIVRGWNVCPGGCGCKCRAVAAVREAEEGMAGALMPA